MVILPAISDFLMSASKVQPRMVQVAATSLLV